MKTNSKKNISAIAMACMALALGEVCAQNTSYKANTIPIGGTNCTAFGDHALFANTGSSNTATGHYAMASNTNASNNTADGEYALYLNTVGSNNVATGYTALYYNTNGAWNTACGSASLIANTSGRDNTGFGFRALQLNTTGSSNTAVGSLATVSSGALSNSTAIGFNAKVNASNKIRLGNSFVTVVEGPVAYTVSDGRFKNNISESDVKGLEFIKRLRPVVYNFDTRKLEEFLTKNIPAENQRKLDDNEFAASTAIRQSGFIAQEVEKAAQDAGYNFNGVHKPENDDDNYSLAYGQFVVPLVKGMQEQQIMIEQQQKQINELKKLINVITSGSSEASSLKDVEVYPNPNGGVFNIRTKGIEAGVIEVINLEGKSIYKTAVTNSTSDYKIDLSGYAHGIYLVTISSNGQEVTSKKLIIE